MRPVAMVNVDEISVKRGETLTVWLMGVQVELRVVATGEPQIYVDQSKIKVMSFGDWTPHDRAGEATP